MEGTMAEIRIFGGSFAPRNWAFCAGQLMPISQNQALFSLLGTIYGGDGRTTFALPDLRGRVPIGPGTGPGLTNRREGQRGGAEYNILNANQLPSHNHTATFNANAVANISVPVLADAADLADPSNATLATSEDTGGSEVKTYSNQPSDATLKPFTAPLAGNIDVGLTGNNQPINNMQPWLSTYYIICLQGVFPSRS
ncbi:phage tail protein [Aquimarina sp. BL5]|uniref:phage tail protein n=1 Tax=Aquimarina sp. BL5 TaxID=1714860 RepID=UPI000E499ECE|nr:tail fiber protein [Aquimarina sp. BL5]AXT51507.1 phage tail protein [Aquimarina sp. BL5]RKN06924.1 phage tail protein [Aquimarina sp. BL5]